MTTSDGQFPDRGPAVLAASTASLVLASVFVIARMATRWWIVRKVTLDDYFMLVGWVLAFGVTFTIDYGVSKGLGRYDQNIPEAWMGSLRRCEYAFSVLYNPALMATKTSILIFYLRLSKNTNAFLRIGSYLILGVVNVAGIVLTFLNIFQCTPIRTIFDGTSASHCFPLVTLYLCSAPVNIFTDLAILALPLPVLTSMRLPQQQKNILVFTFCLGIFVVITDIIRIYYLQQASSNVAIGFVDYVHSQIGGEIDFAWYASLSLMWTAVEVNVGIVCACIPTLKPLVIRFVPKLIGKVRTRTERSSGSVSRPDTTKNGSQNMPSRTGSELIADIQPLPAPLPPVADIGGNQEQEMDMMGFLTVPGMDPDKLARTKTVQTQGSNTVHFGFVHIHRPRSMLTCSAADSWKFCSVVTILFFLWGFSYGLLAVLNYQISELSNSSTSHFLALQSAYFGGYLVGPMTVGQYVLRRAGFKYTFITGLCIYATGTLMFWPSANLVSFPGFVVSNFVVGYGLAVLETAANPFLALCGPSDYSEMRLLLAQGVQGVGSVVSPLLASKVLFVNIDDADSLIDVEWAYLSIALFDVALALFLYYMPLPEATDDELHMAAMPRIPAFNQTILDVDHRKPSRTYIGSIPLLWITLILGVSSQFFYLSAQESLTVWFSGLLSSVASKTPISSDLTKLTSGIQLALTPDNYLLIGRTAFTVSRFLGALIVLFIKPRFVLMAFYVGDLVFAILTFSLTALSADGVAAIVIGMYFFEGPIWPLIYSMALRRQGRRTKIAGALITSGGAGGGIFPWVMYGVQQASGQSVQFSHCVLIALVAAGALYPAWLCFYPPAGEQIDPLRGRWKALLLVGKLFRRSHDGETEEERRLRKEEKHKKRKQSLSFLKSVDLWHNHNKGRSTTNSHVAVAEHREGEVGELDLGPLEK